MTRAAARPRRKSSLMQFRHGMLWFAVIGTVLIGVRHLLPGEAGSGGAFDAFCPFGAFETLWAYVTRGQTLKTTSLLNFAMLGGVLSVSLVAGRAFCGWMCPVGAVQEGLAKLSRRWSAPRPAARCSSQENVSGSARPPKARFPLHLPEWSDRPLRYAKYLVLGSVLVSSVFAIYPPLQPFCPARALFSFKLTSGLIWSVLLVFILTSLAVERLWCKYLCPLGAALALFNKISPIRLQANAAACNHCGRCDLDCSMGIQDVPDNLTDPECIRCLECFETCARPGALQLQAGYPGQASQPGKRD